MVNDTKMQVADLLGCAPHEVVFTSGGSEANNYALIPFMDWDRCKAARRELVVAFMSSSWPPRDLALTACRTNEVARIIRRVAKQHDGEAYIKRIASDVGKLPKGCRNAVDNAISEVLTNPSAKYDWRD